jgi:predicted lysophospholipase L1 biosynthesis ABC-type transport system permease subunit
MAVETTLIDLGIQILINVIVLSPVLWISGRLLAGKDKAKFTDALWIVVLGTLIGIGFNYFFAESLGAVTGIIASIIMLIIWLGLVKHFFDCGWLKALAISILAVIILIVITVLLEIIGIGIGLIGF